MAVLKNRNGTEMLIDCCCGCDTGIRFRLDKDDEEYYCLMSFTNGNFYRDQNDSAWMSFKRKLRKLWAIISNKDFYYADITMSKEEFEEYKELINSI